MALLETVLLQGTRAAQPAASAVGPASLYSVTDEDFLIEQSDGAAWNQYGPTPGGGSGGAGDFEVVSKHSLACFAGFTAGGYGIMPVGTEGLGIAGSGNTRLLTATNSWFDLVTAAAGTAQARVHSGGFTLFQRRHDIDAQFIIIAPTTLTNVRVWVGLTSAAFGDVDTHGGHCAAFRFSSVAGDTGWRACTRDGATQTTSANIGTVVSATEYRLRIRCVLAGTPTVYFSVNGGAETAQTANLPTSSQDLGFGVCCVAQAASARNVSFGRCLIKWGTAV